jgi:serine/threonine-protein kinase SRPK3
MLDKDFKYTIISNRYIIIKKIGSGKYSKIYIVYDTKTKTDDSFYVLKIYSDSDEALEQYDDEIKNIKKLEKLNINNVIKIIDHFKFSFDGEDYNGIIYPVMVGSLYDIIDKQSIFSIDATRKIIKNLLQTLQKLHEKAKFVHMDIKPENILLCGDSNTLKNIKASIKKPYRKLLKECGQKKAVTEFCNFFKNDDNKDYVFKSDSEDSEDLEDEDSEDDNTDKKFKIKLTDEKYIVDPTICLADFGTCCDIEDRKNNYNMTIYYRSPEDILDHNTLNVSTDLWAVACCVYELMTGELLFKIEDNDYNCHCEKSHSQLLYKIQKLMGNPDEKYLLNCRYKLYYYTNDGNLKGWKFDNTHMKSISERLVEHKFSKEDADEVDDFCMKILKWNVLERININKLLEHPFLNPPK